MKLPAGSRYRDPAGYLVTGPNPLWWERQPSHDRNWAPYFISVIIFFPFCGWVYHLYTGITTTMASYYEKTCLCINCWILVWQTILKYGKGSLKQISSTSYFILVFCTEMNQMLRSFVLDVGDLLVVTRNNLCWQISLIFLKVCGQMQGQHV
jgi:hypothetical protein